MFITAAVFTVTGAVVAVRSALGYESEDGWALPLEEDLQGTRKRLYCFFNSSAYRRPEPMTFTVDNINVEYCDDLVYTFLGVDPTAANIVSKVRPLLLLVEHSSFGIVDSVLVTSNYRLYVSPIRGRGRR